MTTQRTRRQGKNSPGPMAPAQEFLLLEGGQNKPDLGKGETRMRIQPRPLYEPDASERLLLYRLGQNLSTADFAEILDMEEDAYCDIESGVDISLSPEEQEEIADITLNVVPVSSWQRRTTLPEFVDESHQLAYDCLQAGVALSSPELPANAIPIPAHWKLQLYLLEGTICPAELASLLGCCPECMGNILDGVLTPDPIQMVKIHFFTQAFVGVSDWRVSEQPFRNHLRQLDEAAEKEIKEKGDFSLPPETIILL